MSRTSRRNHRYIGIKDPISLGELWSDINYAQHRDNTHNGAKTAYFPLITSTKKIESALYINSRLCVSWQVKGDFSLSAMPGKIFKLMLLKTIKSMHCVYVSQHLQFHKFSLCEHHLLIKMSIAADIFRFKHFSPTHNLFQATITNKWKPMRLWSLH